MEAGDSAQQIVCRFECVKAGARNLGGVRTICSGKVLGIQGLAVSARWIGGNTLFDANVPARLPGDAANR